MDPLENLVNYLTGDTILFGFVQALLFLVSALSLINDFSGRSKDAGNLEKPSSKTLTISTSCTSIYLGMVVFFAVVCTTTEEIAGHRIFWLIIDLGLLTYLFFFNKWFAGKLAK